MATGDAARSSRFGTKSIVVPSICTYIYIYVHISNWIGHNTHCTAYSRLRNSLFILSDSVFAAQPVGRKVFKVLPMDSI